MYITETTESVKKLIEELEQKEDLNKLKFLIYIFGLLNNNQINDKNEASQDLVENNEMKIFTLETIGLSQNACTLLLQYFAMLYKKLTFTENAYEDNGNIMGFDYDKDDKKLDSQFEKLEYNEKLDMFSEVIIRYDNETYFKDKITMITFDSKSNGFDLAHLIQEQKVQ